MPEILPASLSWAYIGNGANNPSVRYLEYQISMARRADLTGERTAYRDSQANGEAKGDIDE
ncbi:hypothetical protein [Mesorhizobium sp. Cs1299R1N3]|uniref:hypothetical protein n=1 Tax=Mesorhizobium sp. Cs1299R1N3 TaxID=3015173 RepID=UPI00301D1361